MKNIILVVIAVVIVIGAGVLIWGTNVGSTPYWETDAVFGMWQDEVIITFTDGTTESLKLIDEGRTLPFTVSYGGREIDSIDMALSASVSGTGYDGATIKGTDFGYEATIMSGNTVKYTWRRVRDWEYNVAIGNTRTLFPPEGYVYGAIVSYINNNPSSYPAGNYQILFEATGTVQYKGYPDGGDWVTCSMPPTREPTIVVSHTPTGQIVVTLGSGVWAP